MKLQFDKNNQYKLTLPKVLIEAKGWKKGDEVEIKLEEKGGIVLRKK